MTKEESSTMKLTSTLFLLTVIWLLTAGATKPSKQPDTLSDLCRQYQKTDAEMNRVYQQIRKAYQSDQTFLLKLKLAQQAWLRYRDAHLEALYPATEKRVSYGSINNDCQCLVRSTLTQQRTAELQQWVKGAPEGDVCAGSIHRKK